MTLNNTLMTLEVTAMMLAVGFCTGIMVAAMAYIIMTHDGGDDDGDY